MSHPITDKRGTVVHLSALGFKPLCKPATRIVFHATLIGAMGTRLCPVCAERDLRSQYATQTPEERDAEFFRA